MRNFVVLASGLVLLSGCVTTSTTGTPGHGGGTNPATAPGGIFGPPAGSLIFDPVSENAKADVGRLTQLPLRADDASKTLTLKGSSGLTLAGVPFTLSPGGSAELAKTMGLKTTNDLKAFRVTSSLGLNKDTTCGGARIAAFAIGPNAGGEWVLGVFGLPQTGEKSLKSCVVWRFVKQ